MGRRTRTLLQAYQILADPHDSPLPASEPPTPTSSYSLDTNKVTQNQQQQQPFDSSMGLTILVLFTALFFIGFFSIYIRRFAHDSPVELSRRRRLRSGLSTTFPNSNLSPALSTRPRSTRKGLDFNSIRSLPVVEYDDSERHPICAVCLAEFEQGESVKVLPFCQHLFHVECIDTWLVARASCPVCRTSKIFKEEQRVEEMAATGGGDGGGGVRRCCSCSEIEVVESEEGRGGLQRTRSF